MLSFEIEELVTTLEKFLSLVFEDPDLKVEGFSLDVDKGGLSFWFYSEKEGEIMEGFLPEDTGEPLRIQSLKIPSTPKLRILARSLLNDLQKIKERVDEVFKKTKELQDERIYLHSKPRLEWENQTGRLIIRLQPVSSVASSFKTVDDPELKELLKDHIKPSLSGLEFEVEVEGNFKSKTIEKIKSLLILSGL